MWCQFKQFVWQKADIPVGMSQTAFHTRCPVCLELSVMPVCACVITDGVARVLFFVYSVTSSGSHTLLWFPFLSTKQHFGISSTGDIGGGSRLCRQRIVLFSLVKLAINRHSDVVNRGHVSQTVSGRLWRYLHGSDYRRVASLRCLVSN